MSPLRIRAYEFRTKSGRSIFGHITLSKPEENKEEYFVELKYKDPEREESISYKRDTLEEAVDSMESTLREDRWSLSLANDLPKGWSGQNMIYSSRLPGDLK